SSRSSLCRVKSNPSEASPKGYSGAAACTTAPELRQKRTFVARPYFLAQNSTRGGPTSGPPLHSTSRSPIEIGNVLGPQKAEIATSSLPQPLEQSLDRQSSRRTAT